MTTGWNPASSPRSRVHVKRSMTEAWIAQDILDLAAASAGGTMGVMGTVLALELKKTEVMKRSEVRRNLFPYHRRESKSSSTPVV